MATYGWRKDRPVSEALYAEGERFAFHQAVRLLERMLPDREAVGEAADPEHEAVRFSSRPSLGFPASEIQRVRPPENGGPARMEVNFLGLAGALGPLPRSFTEPIIARLFRGDATARDFLDIFNHRLVSLLYRALKKYRPALDFRPPDRGRVARCLYALMGLGTPHLQGRMGVRDRGLLFYGGLLAGPRRPMVGLERLIGGYFGVTATIEPFHGIWHTLEDDQVTRIGLSGCNRTLGVDTILGRRVWDQQGACELRIGPLSHRQLLDFLPNGRAFPALCALVRFCAGDDLEFRFRLAVAAAEVPATRLGRAGDVRLGWSARLERDGPSRPRLGRSGGSRLGWTSWLRTKAPAADDQQIVLRAVAS